MSFLSRYYKIRICGCKNVSGNINVRLKHCKSSVNKSEWKSVVGLEIHAQISSQSKLFSAAGTEFGTPINNSVSFFDAAIPGTLPVLNKRCVEAGVLTALALNCKVNQISTFDRKHYFYADLPAGYQITQQRKALANQGHLDFQVFTPGIHKTPYTKTSKIQQLQLEQDSGKSLHDDVEARSLVDLNRAGVPLMELVFDPDLSDGEEAAALVKELILILQRLGTCSCKMEEGALRVDANVSVQKRDSSVAGPRTEIKNIGSVRGVANAVTSEISRQLSLVLRGERVISETRSYDANTKSTVPMRDKEEKQDYRFMPEPNLPPLRVAIDDSDVCSDLVNVPEMYRRLPELPESTRHRLRTHFGISVEAAIALVNEEALLSLFSDIMSASKSRNPRLATNLVLQELPSCLNKSKKHIDECCVTSLQLGDLLDMLQRGDINLLTAKKVLQLLVDGDAAMPSKMVEEKGWQQINDPDAIRQICEDALKLNPKLVQEYCAGKNKVFGAFVGYVAKTTNQKADMAAITKCLQLLLDQAKKSTKS